MYSIFGYMSEKPDTEKIMGVRIKTAYPHGPLEFFLEEIPAETLTEMIRHHLKPILEISEAERKNRQFITINDFATKNNNGR